MPSGARTVYVDPPLRGEWMAVHTPAAGVPSHGTNFFGQRYAYDFIRCAPGRLIPHAATPLRQLVWTVPARRFFAWDEAVHAAFPGSVVATGDGWPDRLHVNAIWQRLRLRHAPPTPTTSDFRPLVGNFVLIEGEPGVALYAHLRSGSVRVAQGDRVEEGEVIGAVGNSGNSTMPHLHFHLMNARDPYAADGVLCGFRNYSASRGESWEPVREGVPGKFERLRFD